LNVKKFIIFFIGLFLSLNLVLGQSPTVKKAVRKKEKTEQQQKKDYEKAKKEAIRKKQKMQSDEIQKNLKGTNKRADKFYRRESFIKKVFKKHNRKRK
jgi:hypothetical protein